MMARGTAGRIAVVLGVLLLAAGTAAGQTVVGRVVEEGTLRPLRGAFVVLEDEAGGRHRGVLAAEDGRFVLRAAGAGRYRLVAELIGYAGTRTEPLELGAGETVERELVVPVQAVSLEGIQVETGSRCRRRPGSGPATARLWEEARKALEVARWSEAEGVLRLSVASHRRELDATTMRVTKQTERVRQGLYDRSPYRSIPAERLEAGGYIQEAPDGTRDYYAPDAAVLLSESFLASHCFAVVEAEDDGDLVGLGFEPVPERELPDVQGALWLSRSTGELKRLDFHYVNVREPLREWSQVGGRVEFERLATGLWIVRRWRIRMPLEVTTTGGFGNSARQVKLVTLVEDGAEVTAARTRDGQTLSEKLGGTVHGLAVRGDGAPLAGAVVRVEGLDLATRTGPDGAYRLEGLPGGRHTVRMAHPDLELLGLEEPEWVVDVESGRAARLPLDAGLAPARAGALCRQARGDGSAAGGAAGANARVIFGVVSDRAGEPAPGALVRYESGSREGRALTDSAGAFRLCLDGRGPLRLAATAASATAVALDALEPLEVEAEPGFSRVDLTVSGSQAAASTASGRWTNAVVGSVLEEGTGEPVAAATVELLDGAGDVVATAISDERGRFTIAHPGHGDAYRVRAQRIGYATSEGGIDFGTGQELRLDVLLSTRAIELDPIVVRERRRGLLVDVGYYDRLRKGAGVFVEREEIERRRPARTTDLFRGVPGMKLIVIDGLRRDVRLAAQITLRDMNRECQPKVFVDDVLARPGGEMKGGRIAPPTASIDDIVDPDRIEAMEVYTRTSEIPPRYGGADAACGVIVFWTRRGT